jgi:alpha-beta hydrolase superfamily lysophospholipase
MFWPALERALLIVAAVLVAVPAWAAGRVVNLAATDGTPLVGMFYESSARPAPGVVLVHMLGRSKDDWALFAERLQSAGLTVLAIDLRGHGRSGGNASDLTAMVSDVQAAVGWLAAHPSVRPLPIGIVGASLGANLAGIVAADSPVVRAVALVSPSLDYRGLRLDASVMKKIGDRPVWLTASAEDPYAVRSVKELAGENASREQRLSAVRAHGTSLFNADHDLARGLVDWLRLRLIF